MSVSLEELYRGTILERPVFPQSQALFEAALREIRQHFGPEPSGLAERDFREALSACRSRLATPEFSRLAARCLITLGVDPVVTVLDQVRFRAVSRGLELVEAARPVFYNHRDTWYGNPRCQINAWMPLVEVNDLNSFQFFPHHFENPIENDSHLFISSHFQRQGGFGKITGEVSPCHYPRALVAPQGKPEVIKLAPGQLLLFAGAHLHQTLVNRSGRPRFSLDFRFYRADHLQQGIGAPDPDNRSQGLLLESFQPLSSLLS